MTKRSFILFGLFLIALAALWVSVETYLLLCFRKEDPLGPLSSLFYFWVIPILFWFVVWRYLRFSGRSKKLSAASVLGCALLFYFGNAISWPLIELLEPYSPHNTMLDEIGAWADAGSKGVLEFKSLTILKVSAFNGLSTLIGTWPLIFVLILVGFDRRPPSDMNPQEGTSSNKSRKRKTAFNVIKKQFSQISFPNFKHSVRQT